ncbi:MAG: flagellar motor protein MotB [Hyphomicrobiales bacterium]
MARPKIKPDGPPEWIVTFADLMSLLVVFFVLIISFSIQDDEKMQVVAGSMRDAFGVKAISRRAGMMEIEGIPVRRYVKEISATTSPNDTDFANESHDRRRKQGPEANTNNYGTDKDVMPREFALAAASLRQAWDQLPDIAELNENILFEMTPEGLNIQLIDQEGRSMFPTGAKDPYEWTRKILEKMGPVIASLPNRIRITGHTDSTRLFSRSGYTQWDLSADRANAVRRILAQSGVPHNQIFAVTGKADSQPLFPNDTLLAANRRISILIMAEAPPISPDFKL